MPREFLQPTNEGQLWEVLKKTDPLVFSQTCDSFVDLKISKEVLGQTVESINNGEKVGLITTHQSFIEVEVERLICEELNKLSNQPIEACLVYSLPAVGTKVSKIFEWRNEVYKKCHLNMVGIIRQIDRDNKDHPEYTKSITPEMEQLSRDNMGRLAKLLKGDQGCLFIIPFESTLKSGRINPETGEIYGMQQVLPDISLIGRMIDKKNKVIPCGIHGGYQLLDPTHQTFTPRFIDAVYNQRLDNDKIITVVANEMIDISTTYPDRDRSQIFHDIIIRTAKNIPPIARGCYNQFCQ